MNKVQNNFAHAKYTPQFLHKLEDIFAESDYVLRYEKGNFKSGFCILKEQKVVIINKFYPLDGKINCLLDLLKELPLNIMGFSEKNKQFYFELTQTQLQF